MEISRHFTPVGAAFAKDEPQQAIASGSKIDLPPKMVRAEEQVLGATLNIAATLQRQFSALGSVDALKTLLETRHLTPQDLLAITVLERVTTAAQLPAPPPEASALSSLKFDPSAWSNVSVLIGAIATLNLARAAGAETQGKFAQLAYSAALAQGQATIAAGQAEMMAAVGGAVVGVGLAAASAKMSLDGHKLRHDDIKQNLVESNALQKQLADAMDGPLASKPALDIRATQARIEELQMNSRLQQRTIEKQLTGGQTLMAMSNVLSAMTAATARVQASMAQSDALERGAEAGIHGSVSRAEEQVAGEDAQLIKDLLQAAEQILRSRVEVMSGIASARV